MKRENFISLLLTTVGLCLFGTGMCMCLLPEWNAFHEGIALGAAGLVILLLMVIIRRRILGKAPLRLSLKTAGAILLATVGALTLGVGICMCMVWEGMLLWGIPVGVIGILLLLCLIPFCKGTL